MESCLVAAICYAERRLPVLPIHRPIERWDGRIGCSCGRWDCEQQGKHPRLIHGLLGASANLELVRHWWSGAPKANVAVVTGPDSGLFAIDVDDRNDGDRTLAYLERKNGKLPRTLTARSGGGGLHLYFKFEPGIRSRSSALGPGLDVKGAGGFIIAAPSLHQSGRRYQWVSRAPIVPAPGWLLTLLREPLRPPASPVAASRTATAASLAGIVRRLESAHEGERNALLYWGACRMAEAVRAGLISQSDAVSLIANAASRTGLGRDETDRTIASALRRGAGS
jgi:hypothetical protein